MYKSLFLCLKIFAVLILIGCSVTAYIIYHYSHDLPDYSQLARYYPPSVTRIYSRDGKLIEEYAFERRVFVPINNVPSSLIESFIAAEDKNFYTHPGIDLLGIVRAAFLNISNYLHNRRMEGASTITQQVVKNFLLTNEVSLERKIKEVIISYMISRIFTKHQILELYLNQTFFGRGAYGVAAAAQNYFNKSVEELTIAESAFIAALPKAPSELNPDKNYSRVKARRDYVIERMFEDGYITRDTMKEAIGSPIVLRKRAKEETVTADYYAEQVREEVIRMLNSKEEFYRGGLTIITSLDAKMQQLAENSLRKGLREFDRKSGFRKPIANIPLDNWQEELKKLPTPSSLLEYKLAVVLDVSDNHAKIGLIDGSKAKIPIVEMQWARSNLKSVKTLLKKGDVIVVEPIKDCYALRQIPEVNGAIMVMNPHTGQVLASVGGYDFSTSKFDRVTQALRQPGSLSKTFVYLAALENGVKPNQIFNDGPIEIIQGPGMPSWCPKNYEGQFLGDMTMRTGFEKSRNLITVRVATAVGLTKIVDIIKRFGINNEPKKVYSMVLGSIETTLSRITNAYAIIANGGKKVEPHFVELIQDRNGKIIYRRDNRECFSCNIADSDLDTAILEIPKEDIYRVTDEASNYQITSFLTGAIDSGTGYAARKLGKIIAGKTGTSNDSKDTWFIGFTPKIVVGSYVGYDTPKELGKKATGSNVVLPIFIDFMNHAYKDEPSLPFKVPDSIKLIAVDRITGKMIPNGTVIEAFKVNNIQMLENDYMIDNHDIFDYVPGMLDQSQEIY
ncbi:penicillin-binding protein 1A [Rickettsia prowazekii]|uniref:Penicillin-binding protein 1A n=2 Tax=Rickettsia prowazekii TaxID=782 RepID=PBPA_RICPR|nr:penicillin-binding protein 1A [Rickettsia prowazekii]Q9ZCE9.1 RecName: Full=Penicillin-binding protein 1A; Short=PBP-1a; Short=PBP1a; Includes: RecName: Full=Penicillin-insensitive transglycosylase; AltName: Full=Peptidoglycan TGase; Includes: RecName: Full=Penicillin-sensitive transpeptidase; AltName: Full=DD-transpeptidase [Rickettsia prowazekii str. Madrid E]ADE30373.1 Penicillin-binding protein 1A [Rickettsia prowazekii str. Rp22]AFE49602.1 penicillin-binding protein 1A (mrcA) [Rickettsia